MHSFFCCQKKYKSLSTSFRNFLPQFVLLKFNKLAYFSSGVATYFTNCQVLKLPYSANQCSWIANITKSIENHASNMCCVWRTAHSCFATAQDRIEALRETGAYDRFEKDFFNICKPHNSDISLQRSLQSRHSQKVILVDHKTLQGSEKRTWNCFRNDSIHIFQVNH